MNDNVTELRMSLDHSQSGIAEGLQELNLDFKYWLEHPHQRATWGKLMEHLVSFRWILDQHFTRVAGEGYLENVACQYPGMAPEGARPRACLPRWDLIDHPSGFVWCQATREAASPLGVSEMCIC